MPNPQIVNIPVDVKHGYAAHLKIRLRAHAITQREVAQEMGIDETQFSRWVGRPSADTGKPMDLRLSNALEIERAILAIIRRRQNG